MKKWVRWILICTVIGLAVIFYVMWLSGEAYKSQHPQDAVSVAFKLMLGIPTMVLHDKYGWGGKKRLPEFGEYVLDLYDSFEKGYVTLEDIEKCIYEETGISFQE